MPLKVCRSGGQTPGGPDPAGRLSADMCPVHAPRWQSRADTEAAKTLSAPSRKVGRPLWQDILEPTRRPPGAREIHFAHQVLELVSKNDDRERDT